MAGGSVADLPHSPEPGLLIVPVRFIDPLEKRFGLPAPLWSPASLIDLWRRVGQSDVLQIHDFLYLPCLVAMGFAACLGKPVVLTQHVGVISFKSKGATLLLQILNATLGRLAMRKASQVVFVGSQVMGHFAAATTFRRPPKLISNGLDHSVYRPAGVKTFGSSLHCLFVGRFVEKKGVSLLRDCVGLENTRWSFVGWGPQTPSLWQPVPPNAVVYGELRGVQVVPFFQQADLLVLPSTGEGFPLVIQEALACGTPVLISTEVAESFPARDPVCVFDVELRVPDPVTALRTKLAALTQERSRLRDARAAALTLAKRWSWQTCASEYAELYKSLTSPSG